MQGIIEVKIKMYMECDVEREEAEAIVQGLGDHLSECPMEGVFIDHVEVEEIKP